MALRLTLKASGEGSGPRAASQTRDAEDGHGRNSSLEKPIIGTANVGRWTVKVTNHITPFEPWDSVHPHDALTGPTFEATFEVDRETYDRLIGAAPTYTIEHTIDHNPWHRHVSGWRARLRKIRDGIWWTFQRRILRRELVESTKITIPNCQLKGASDG